MGILLLRTRRVLNFKFLCWRPLIIVWYNSSIPPTMRNNVIRWKFQLLLHFLVKILMLKHCLLLHNNFIRRTSRISISRHFDIKIPTQIFIIIFCRSLILGSWASRSKEVFAYIEFFLWCHWIHINNVRAAYECRNLDIDNTFKDVVFTKVNKE